jgi:hypothetical protein
VKIKKKEKNRRAVARRRKRTQRPTLARLRRKSSPGARWRRPAVDSGTQTTDRKNPSGISPRTRPGRRRQRRITAHELETQSDWRRVTTKIETGPAAAVRASTETNQPTAAACGENTEPARRKHRLGGAEPLRAERRTATGTAQEKPPHKDPATQTAARDSGPGNLSATEEGRNRAGVAQDSANPSALK